jgi:hypothetical protein
MGDAGLPGDRTDVPTHPGRERKEDLRLAAPAPLAALTDWLSHATGRRQRRRWVGNGRTHIEVRAVHRPGTGDLARQVERRLARLDGVNWAQVNHVLAAWRYETNRLPTQRPRSTRPPGV